MKLPSATIPTPHAILVMEGPGWECCSLFSLLTLGPGLGGEGRRAGNAAVVGQDAEDGRLERCQEEQDL